jgi:hypothetical protein
MVIARGCRLLEHGLIALASIVSLVTAVEVRAGVNRWEACGAMPDAGKVRELAVEPGDGRTLYALMSQTTGPQGDPITWVTTLWVSRDACASWTRATSFPTGSSALVPDPFRPGTLWALPLDPQAVETGSSYGGSWTRRDFYGSVQNIVSGSRANQLTANPLIKDDLWAFSVYGFYFFGVGGTFYTVPILHSGDGGQSWAQAGQDLDPDHPYRFGSVWLTPWSPSRALSFTWLDKSLRESTDGGRTWKAKSWLAYFPSWMQFAPSRPGKMLTGVWQDLLESTDGAGTWRLLRKLDEGGQFVAFHPFDGIQLFGVTSQGIFRTRNDGDAWSSVAGLDVVDPGLERILAFGTGEHLDLFAAGKASQLVRYRFAGPGTPDAAAVLIPVVLSSGGLSGSAFTSELTLTNTGTADAVLELTYTSAFDATTGTVRDTLPAGRQRIVPDAIAYLRGLGLNLPSSGDRGGSLVVKATGLSSRAAFATAARTTTAVPDGRAGLSYPGIDLADAFSAPSWIFGLRQDERDRSNVAVVHAGTPADGPLTLRLTVYAGNGSPGTELPDLVLTPGQFRQVSGILHANGLSFSSGYVRVEEVAGEAPYVAYGVINDQVNSDGSYVPAVAEHENRSAQRLTVPALVETPSYSSELVIANASATPRVLRFDYAADAIANIWKAVHTQLTIAAGTQVILPSFVDYLRGALGAGSFPRGSSFAGALVVTVESGDLDDLLIAARTTTSALIAGGRYGVFYPALGPPRFAGTVSAWLYGLQQNAESRSNLAIVNNGDADGGETDTYRIELWNGETGAIAASIDGVSVPPQGWKQLSAILSTSAPGVTQGWARVTRTGGKNSFLAYGVVNDGAFPGARSGDGAFVSMALGE